MYIKHWCAQVSIQAFTHWCAHVSTQAVTQCVYVTTQALCVYDPTGNYTLVYTCSHTGSYTLCVCDHTGNKSLEQIRLKFMFMYA